MNRRSLFKMLPAIPSLAVAAPGKNAEWPDRRIVEAFVHDVADHASYCLKTASIVDLNLWGAEGTCSMLFDHSVLHCSSYDVRSRLCNTTTMSGKIRPSDLEDLGDICARIKRQVGNWVGGHKELAKRHGEYSGIMVGIDRDWNVRKAIAVADSSRRRLLPLTVAVLHEYSRPFENAEHPMLPDERILAIHFRWGVAKMERVRRVPREWPS